MAREDIALPLIVAAAVAVVALLWRLSRPVHDDEPVRQARKERTE